MTTDNSNRWQNILKISKKERRKEKGKKSQSKKRDLEIMLTSTPNISEKSLKEVTEQGFGRFPWGEI